MTLQPILSYALKNGWYLTSVPVITANWEATGDDVWTEWCVLPCSDVVEGLLLQLCVST